jgi:hypothetical protein
MTAIERNETPTHARTQYVIKSSVGVYYRRGGHWTTDIDDAERFDFVTMANMHAFIQLGFSCDDFTVDPVVGR